MGCTAYTSRDADERISIDGEMQYFGDLSSHLSA
jgi:hypothetical protein